MKYEKLELEPFCDKQKLHMLQKNAVGDVSELSYVKQLGDQDSRYCTCITAFDISKLPRVLVVSMLYE